ncbi:DUF2339 domain-containing protein [Qipengyuania sp. XHP0207]|uniref:DUF2339 domain-containing protein n=1 Tax=Qipengyuania sp. XHP0207 TaxID=3038078 RepID=UPI00241E0D6C|nr:DUF2339 domain-containing protein [Qipengyuania sp. XHP0207]MDG5749241.1 DUF2339 domain-containing protein [Qipengyuania sp. XHP0207]
MEWLFILVLGGVAYFLTERLRKAERRIQELSDLQDRMYEYMRSMTLGDRARGAAELAEQGVEGPAPTVQAEQGPIATVPKVALQRAEDSDSADAQAPAFAAEHDEQPEHAGTAQPEVEEPAASEPFYARFRFDLEDVFGRRLPIWAGGVTLAVAGVFLVRYSIERGLITPLLRVVMAFLFGGALIAGAEAAYRFREKVADPRVAQALAGAGLATLYAGFYLAGTQYGLIGQTLAFLGLAGVTAGAIALSFRFGLPSAVLGLVGGFAAPALVGGDEANLPLLALYLGLVTGGLVYAGRAQHREWLGIAAIVGGLGWGAMLLLAGDPGIPEILALGLYFVVLGAVMPALSDAGRFKQWLRLAAALVASVQLALLVQQGGFSPLAWALYLLLGATLAFLGWKRPETREANGIAALVGIILYALWSIPFPPDFTLVGIGLALVFAAVPLFHCRAGSDRLVDRLQLALVPPLVAAVAYGTFGDFESDALELRLALASAALALLPAAGAFILRVREDRRWYAGLIGSACALAFAALLMVTPGWSAPLIALLVLSVPLVLLYRAQDPALARLCSLGAVVALGALASTGAFIEEAALLGGDAGATTVWQATLRWAATATPFAAVALLTRDAAMRHSAEVLAALLAYGTLAQVLPVEALAWTAALAAIAIARFAPERTAAQATLIGIALLWALSPLAIWAEAALASLAGDPVFVVDLPGVKAVLTRLLPLAAALWLSGRFTPFPNIENFRLAWLAAPVGLVALHALFKQVFAIETETRFSALGLAERTVWETLLLGACWLAAAGLARLQPQRWLAVTLAAAALLHFILYTFLLHNPLWDGQALGPLPLANLATASYGVAIAATLSLRRWLGERMRPALDAGVIAFASLMTLTLLRHLFVGSVPAGIPLSQTEDLMRSLAGILLALFFLFLGNRLGERSWRIGSLVLILLAVAKVFIVDTAGLEGLLRIASFMALGFSLIGIGWVYSRQLRSQPSPSPMPQ